MIIHLTMHEFVVSSTITSWYDSNKNGTNHDCVVRVLIRCHESITQKAEVVG